MKVGHKRYYAPNVAKRPKLTYGVLTDILPVFDGNKKRCSRLLAKIDASAGGFGCHPWRGHRTKGGYGLVQGSIDYLGFTFLAHRVVWALCRGVEPGSLLIRHSCDNPPCCNPLHLLSGTHQDNTNDMILRDRANYSHAGRPVDEIGKTQAIRLRFTVHASMASICAITGRHRSTISRWCAAYVRERERAHSK